MIKRRTAIVAALLVPVAGLAIAAGTLDDTANVKDSAKKFETAWNKHDSKAISDLWASDGDLICPDGKIEMGPKGVESFFAEQFGTSGMMAKSTIDIKNEKVRFITPDVALSDWDCVMSGGVKQDGVEGGPMMNHVVMISKKEGGQWKFVAARPGVPQEEGAMHDHMNKKPAKTTKGE
jgi:uncharacterized protein (TIGR02246 family)